MGADGVKALLHRFPKSAYGAIKLKTLTAYEWLNRRKILGTLGVGAAVADVSYHGYQLLTPEDLNPSDLTVIAKGFETLISTELVSDSRRALLESSQGSGMTETELTNLIKGLNLKLAGSDPVLSSYFSEVSKKFSAQYAIMLGSAFYFPANYSAAVEKMQLSEQENSIVSYVSTVVGTCYASEELAAAAFGTASVVAPNLNDDQVNFERVKKLERLLGINGVSSKGKPRLAEFLMLVRHVQETDVCKYYDMKRLVGK